MHRSFFARAALVLSITALSTATIGCMADVDDADEAGDEAIGEAAQAATWGDHVTKAQKYVDDVKPENNEYGTPAKLEYDANGVLQARVECGSFTALLFRNTYSSLTSSVLAALASSSSPTAEQWYDGIKPASSRPSSEGISLIPMDNAATTPTGRTMSHFAAGDILAAKYSLDDNTGHVMTAGTITAPPANEQRTLTGTKAIPGVTHVKRWLVKIYDSTKSVHNSTDSRYQKVSATVNDQGIGSGYIYLYEDATANSATLGQLVGWTWSTSSAYTYQFTDTAALDNNDKTTYRPMVIGRFTGL